MKMSYSVVLSFFLFALSSCSNPSKDTPAHKSTKDASPVETVPTNPLKNPYFGQTHQHTGWSFDAYIYNVHLGPENAYRHARGEKVKHPFGYEVQLKTPLDFMMVSDHSEYLGVLRMMAIPGSQVYDNPIAPIVRDVGDDVEKGTKAFYGLVSKTIQEDGTTKADPELNNLEIRRTNWDEYISIAEKYNEPGKFTTFVGYEWSAQPKFSNLHRNIVFKDSKNLPIPFSYFDSEKPEDLWKWMDTQRENGIELLAISHNGNLSNGKMFPLQDSYGSPLSKAYAETRQRNEPLTEIVQTKGQSETHPLVAPNDEFANFEIWTKAVAGPGKVKITETNYVRNALGNGLKFKEGIGVNPYKIGVVGGGDIHTTIISHEEFAHTGEHNLKSSTPEQRLLEGSNKGSSKIEQGSAGLSCVWAESNTRSAIFEAMQRKETWATSGSRITLRIFASLDFNNTTTEDLNWVKKGYQYGVPMGGDLSKAKDNNAPIFLLHASKDPNSGHLDRIQIIKGWVDQNGEVQNKIYNVAWSNNRQINPDGSLPPVGNTVNISQASYTNTIGSAELKKTWTDPEFDPNMPAFYYARVLEIPTPRWSTYDAKKLGVEPPKDFPATIQERAWSSPIWYHPN